MFVFLASCLYISEEEQAARLAALGGDSAEDTAVPGGIEVVSVTPPYGPDAGLTRVEIAGGPFDNGVRVYFGGEVAQVESATKDLIVAYTPAHEDGQVKVRVEGDAGAGELADAFRYFGDATGKVAAIGEFAYFRTAGGYWDASEQDYRRANVTFVEPGDEWVFWKYWAPELDSCLHVDSSGAKTWEYDPGLEKIDGRAGAVLLQELSGTSIELPWSAVAETYEKQDLAPAQYIPGGVYTAELEGSPTIPDLEMDGVYYLPEAFQVTSPDIEADILPLVDASFSFRWSGGSPGEAVLLQIGMLNQTKSTFEEQIYCAVVDDGSFDVAASMWTRWTEGRLINILVGRYLEGEGVVPYNNGAAPTAGIYWHYGAGRAQ